MIPSTLQVEATRGSLTESVHRIAVAVVNSEGALLASAGEPDRPVWWRSAAKPFQALPLVLDGAAERFGVTEPELALTCASHSSETTHLDAVTRFMAKVGVAESDLACGVHPPLSPEVARAVLCGTAVMTPKWSNCSGKHTGMLALAKHHGWPVAGYQAAGHPVQERILEEIAQWTGAPRESIEVAPDGCTALCFGLPLRNMALGYARLGASTAAAPLRVTGAMMKHPFLVAGTGRLCTDLMSAWPGRILSKVGANGVYCATLPELRLGIALKVEDGDGPASAVALLEVLRQVLEREGADAPMSYPLQGLGAHARQPIVNTRGVVTGELLPAGVLRFSDD